MTESAGVARTNEIVVSGLPLPRQTHVRSLAQLQVRDGNNQPVPACFHVLARWNAGRADTNAPLQWILVEMPVTLQSRESRPFRLVVSETPSSPAPFSRIEVTQTNGQIRVDTGAARFVLGGDPNRLFDEIALSNGAIVATGQPLLAVANSNQTIHAASRRVALERVSDLCAVVVVDGAYDLPPVGGGGLASSRRYEFFAGSPTVIVRQEAAWEGSLFYLGVLASDGVPNGLRMQLVRDPLALNLGYPRRALAWGDIDAPPAEGAVSPGDTAEIRQQLRAQRTDPLRFETALGSSRVSGRAATAGLLALSDGAKTIAAALNRMDRYEPQALAWLTNDSLALDLVADRVWLGARQALFTRFGLCVTPGGLDAGTLKRSLWAKLNHPLRAWPSPAWFAASQAVEEFPVGELSTACQDFDRLVPLVLTRTTNLVDTFGLPGLQTYGLFPRYWGNPAEGYDELTNPDSDPTPGESWDDVYWGATWTDYHNTSALAHYWAMRSGEGWWLDDIAWPAAWRMLHTQIIHGAPGDDYFYIGQAPCGYGGYRADFNSSHAYFDNLLLYYWLSGDYSVVEALTRGAATMRQFLYPERPSVPCDPLRPAPNEWAHPVGRVASQWCQVFRFVGLAGTDPTFLEDYRGTLSRAVAQYYAELNRNGRLYGFWCDRPLPATGPATNHTDQVWMLSAYDLKNLYRWLLDSGDEPLGLPARRPSEVLSAWANTLTYLASRAAPGGDGTAGGTWPNMIEFSWSGARMGGSLSSVTNYLIPGVDNYLWDTGKASLSAVISRAGDFTGNTAVRQLAADLVVLTLRSSWNQGTPPPLGKEQGLFLSPLPRSAARVAAPGPLSLRISQTNGQVWLDWPGALQSWLLESAPAPVPASGWHPVTNGVGALEAVFDSPAAGARFFRLRAH